MTELARLRLLLSVPDPSEWTAVHGYVSDPERRARDLSEALPDAVRLGHAAGKLRGALGPAIEETLRLSVQRNPEVVTAALFPIIGSMIRRYIADALAALQDSIAQTVESSFSIRSLGWRLQALRQGRPFAAILLEKSLCFRVEQVFLIDRRTGLLLLHRRAPEVDVKDPAVISGMLTAIQDFVQDSFGGRETALDAVRLGEHTLWINTGPKAVLTCVIRGVPPVPLRQLTETTLEDIHKDFAAQLAHFNGETAPFADAAGHLDRCLLGGAGARHQGRSPKKVIVAAAAVALILLGWWAYRWYQQYRFDQFLAQLRAQPGLAVIEGKRDGKGWVVRGMRDPMAADGASLAQAEGFPNVRFQWEPYHSLSAPFGPARAADERVRFIERTVLRYDQFAVHAPAGEIETLTADWKALAAAGSGYTLRILGAAAEGNGLDERLSRQRVANVQSALEAQGIPPSSLRYEPGPLPPDRTVRFRVVPATP